MTSVCGICGTVFWAGDGHACDPADIPAALLPDGTPHPDPFLAERGWQVVRGVYRRVLADADEAA